ncbi:MAG: serine/threonine protein kinase [Acidobacteria bacterium]|nr:serine/threonine protein kinase [Acidobacteriota bacterium]
MNAEEWARLEAAFVELTELDPGDRAERLSRWKAEEPKLAVELSAMLAEHEADRPLSAESLLPSGEPEALDPDPWTGRRVGGYQLEGLLGGGGMGAVYGAHRADGVFEQRVAVKLMHRWLQAGEGEERFRLEQRILARLEHPNIARILDGGVADGVPFLVMERVDGEPLTRFADSRQLSVEERLRLFVDVCRAVHAAHRQLVVHRDLKPANVLVTEAGLVKLLDFGIAKLLEAEGSLPVAATRTGLRLLTPEYASPEQVLGQPVTTATDVYGLGLLLYELLTGTRAQAIESSSPTGIERAVCREAPEPPSRRVASAALAKRLRGDLDVILATCLAKEPERRYASAEELALDLERHLSGLPVQARRESFGYLAGKFVRRNRLAVAAASLATAGLVVGLVLALAGMVRAQRAEERAAAEAEAARQTSDFLVELFRVSDPIARPEELSARELLERGAARLEGPQEEVPPALRARLLGTLAHIYLNLGVSSRSVQLFEAEVAAREALGEGPGTEALGRARSLLAAAKYKDGDYAGAEAVARQALADLEAVFGPDALQILEALQSLGIALWYEGDFAGARRHLTRALDIEERAIRDGGAQEDRRLVAILNNVAILDAQLGDLDRAEERYRRALEVLEKTRGPRHPDVAGTLNNLALVEKDRGQAVEAVALHERALSIRLEAFGEESEDVAESRNNLGDALVEAGQPARALTLFEEALAVRIPHLGEDHPLTLSTRFNLARALAGVGRADEAEAKLEALVPVFERVFGADHFNLSFPFEALADLCLERDPGPRCVELAQRAWELRDKTSGSDAPPTREARRLLEKARAAAGSQAAQGTQ